jgi:hypothetical protein
MKDGKFLISPARFSLLGNDFAPPLAGMAAEVKLNSELQKNEKKSSNMFCRLKYTSML